MIKKRSLVKRLLCAGSRGYQILDNVVRERTNAFTRSMGNKQSRQKSDSNGAQQGNEGSKIHEDESNKQKPDITNTQIYPTLTLQAYAIKEANFPRDNDGTVFHLQVKPGQVANRILSVGSSRRAKLLSKFLDSHEELFVKESTRGFVVYTGKMNNVPISIISTGMGTSMMDFMVRETRAIVDGPMAIVRLGTCGTPNENVKLGSIVVVSEGAVLIRRNPDAFATNDGNVVTDYYSISNPVYPDKHFNDLVSSNLKDHVKSGPVVEGMNASGDSFYSSQGRKDNNFDDRNEGLIEALRDRYPRICSLEMETFQLLDLARVSRNSIRSTAAGIVVAQRHFNEFLSDKELQIALEKEAGLACLNALCQWNPE